MDAALTFDELTAWLKEENITLEQKSDANENSKASDIAFKTKDNTLIGFTTIQSNEITYDKIIHFFCPFL